MVRHPINTATAIGSAVSNPVQTAKAIGSAVSKGYSDFQNGNADVKANITGKVIGDVAQLFVGAGEAKAAINGIRGAKAAEEASVVTKVATTIADGDVAKIENAASRINKPINVVGSRASGTAKATSDWDYVIDGMTNKDFKKIKNSLPGAASKIDNAPNMIDIFKGKVDKTKPYVTINPK